MPRLTLYTVGYQGQQIDSFLDLLLGHGISQIIDVRQLPFSRKADFSKKRFAARLADTGIGYVHLAALGTPKTLRDEVRRTHDYTAFFAAMREMIASQPEALKAALDLARQQPSALLCFEADHKECHRLVVAEAMLEAAPETWGITHL